MIAMLGGNMYPPEHEVRGESLSVIAMLGGNMYPPEHEVRGESISVIAMLGGNMYHLNTRLEERVYL